MTMALERLVERQIQKALAEGRLKGLEGEGRPLPDRPGDGIDPALSAGLRIMKEAGVRPEEFDLKDRLDEARRQFNALTDPEARRAAMTVIADLEMRWNIAREARRAFFR